VLVYRYLVKAEPVSYRGPLACRYRLQVKAGPRKEDVMPEQEAKDEAVEAAEVSPPEIVDLAEEDEVEAHSLIGDLKSACAGWLPV
jgi:hypothetical protein